MPNTLKEDKNIKPLFDAIEKLRGYDQVVRSNIQVATLERQLEHIRWVLEKSDPELFAERELQQIRNHFNGIRSQIDAIPSNPTDHANNAIDMGIDVLTRYPRPRRKQFAKSEATTLISELRGQLDDTLDELNIRKKEQQEAFHKERDKITEIEARTEKLSKDQQKIETNIESALKNATTDLEQRISDRLESANSRLTESLDQFRDNASELRVQFSKEIADAKSKKETFLSSAKLKAADITEEVKSEAESYLARIREIYGLAGTDVTTGDLKKTADSEQKSYVIFTTISVLLFSVGSYFAYTVVAPILNNNVSIETAIARILLTFAIFLPAWYTASLANKHRKAHNWFRSLAVRVAAFDPFLLELSPDERIEMKRQMVSVFFATEFREKEEAGTDRNIFERLVKDSDKLNRLKSNLDNISSS